MNINFCLYKRNYAPRTKGELVFEIQKRIKNGETDFNYIDTGYLNDISFLFKNFEVKTIYVSEWDVSNVINFDSAFLGTKLVSLDVSGWDVSSGEFFSFMFFNNKKLNFNVKKWNVSNGKNFEYMFSKTRKNVLDLSDWNTYNGKNFKGMFLSNASENFGILKWRIPMVENAENMFEFCSNFNENINNFKDIINAKYFAMLNGCKKFDFEKLDIENFNISLALGNYV
jgi:hypothetical protein